MNNFCRTCTDRGQETCRLPSPLQRVGLVFETFGTSGEAGLMSYGLVADSDTATAHAEMISAVKNSQQSRREGIAACIDMHRAIAVLIENS